MQHGRSRLVGRDTELATLADAVARARRGSRTVVVLEGDAGLGKSRLVAEALSSFREPQDAVATAVGVELAGGEIPYRATIDMLRTLCRDIGVDAVRAAAGAYTPALRPLHPGLAEDGDVDVNPARVLPALVSTLEELAGDRLVWLVVEDLPWVDGPTRDLLAYLLRVVQRGQLLVILTARKHDPGSDAGVGGLVNAWTSLEDVTRIELRPLTADQVTELIVAISGEAATPAQLDRIRAAAHGSPLLTEQLIAAGLDESQAPLLEDPLLARIRRLDPTTLWLVQLAALGESHLEHRLLALAFGDTEAGMEAAVDQALEAGLLGYQPEDRKYTFTHPLLREAADRSLTPGNRLRGHRRWGAVLSATGAQTGDGPLLVAAALHWAATDDDSETFPASLRAARETTRLGAGTETATFLLRAWKLWDRVPGAAEIADRTRDDLYLDLMDGLRIADRITEARAIAERELDRGQREPDTDRLRLLFLRLAAVDLRDASQEHLLAEALAAVDELLAAPPSRMVIGALQALGWRVRWSDEELGLRCFSRALAVSREVGHPGEITWAACQMADQLLGRGRHEDVLDVCRSAMESSRDATYAMALETWQGEALAQSGRLRAGVAQLDRALARLPDPQLSPLEWAFTAIWGASWRIALGLWPEAEATLDQCERLAVTEREVGSQLAAVASELACRRGDLDEASRLAAWANEQLGPWQESGWDTSGDHAAAARARVAAMRGRYAQAHRLLEPMLRRPGKGVAARMWPAVGLAAEIEADRATSPGDAASAEEFIGLVTAATDELPSAGPYLSAWQRHARADLARASRADSAETWTEVCDAWRALEHVTNLGWASYRLAQVCLREGDKLSAEASLTEAWHVADSLGAVPLRDKALELAQLAHVPIRAEAGRVVDGRPPAGGKLRHLTDRELEVLRHVAVGRSNNEIGESLFISPKTVSVHVSSILTKLGVTTRTNAATIAVEEGLDVHRA